MQQENDQAHEITAALINRLKIHLHVAGNIIPAREDHPLLDEKELYSATYEHALKMLKSQ